MKDTSLSSSFRAWVGLVLLLGGIGAPAAVDVAPKPNILVILADDLGYGDLACYGATKVKTPNIDRLAQEGMRFTAAHSPASVCTPSRYNLMTGRYCWRTWAGHGTIWANDPLLIEENRTTVASLLKSAGYFTGCIGKWHLGFGKPGTPGWDDLLGPDFNGELRPGPLDVGFAYFYGMPAVGQHPNIYIEGRRVVGLSPDDPIRFINDPRPEYRVEYLKRPRTKPTNLQLASGKSAEYQFEDTALRLTEKAVGFLEQHQAEPFFLYLAHRNIHSPLKPNARFKGTSEIGNYGDFIHELDWSVGEVLAALARLHLADRTLVVFSSDNGGVPPVKKSSDGHAEVKGHRINGPLRGQKTEVYEGGHRVPMIVRWPGHVAPGAESGALVANTDLLATFAEVAGQPVPAGAGEDSFSFLGTLLARPARRPARQSLVTDSVMGLFAIQEGPWKLIAGQGSGGEPQPDSAPPAATEPVGQLYNLADDIGETRNLYAQKPEIVARLTALLEKITGKNKEALRPKTASIGRGDSGLTGD
jgi:arylsulfatase A-like enzyme